MLVDATALEWVAALANVAAAMGTIGAVVVALFQDQLRDRLFPSSASLHLETEADVTLLGERGIASSLVSIINIRVRNDSPRRVLRRCSVVLEELSFPPECAGMPWRTQ